MVRGRTAVPRKRINQHRVNWNDKKSVVDYAIYLSVLGSGCPQTVYKMPDRPNYNICHTENEHRISKDWIVFRTGEADAAAKLLGGDDG